MKLFNLKYIPLTIVIGFNLFTLFIFYTAPIRWATDNLFLFFFFSVSCQVMIILGYGLGYRKSIRTKFIGTILRKLKPVRLDFIFYFYLLTFLISYAYILKFDVFDIRGMVNLLMIGIADPYMGYSLSLSESGPATIKWTVYFLISILNQVFFIISFIKWRELGKVKKILFILFILIEVFFWMGRGTNFGVIRLITTLAFASIYKLKSIRLNFTKKLRFYFVIIALLGASIYVFSYNMNNRAGNVKLDVQGFSLGSSEVNENAAVFKIIPKDFHQSYMFMVSYLAQGYYHTCLAFDLDFKPTFFLANNPAIINFAEIINIDVWKDTYMYRLGKKGVDPVVNWHSAYLWYASDVSIFGVPFVLFLIGYMFGFSWALILNKDDFLSKIVFIIFGNMLLFLFANNSYLASVFYSFIFILPIWFFTRVKRISW